MSPDAKDEVSYEQLEELEDDFEEVELEMLRHQEKLSKALYEKRAKVVSGIPSFWPLAIEQCPPDIDEYIQPADAVLLLNHLTSLSVERFELPSGDPRSVSIKWEFSANDTFENSVLEKKFWWRNAKDGWSGLVSEPVDIQWKAGKDLTNGMLALVKTIYDEEAAGTPAETETPAKKKLKEQMEGTALDGLSFFAWFGYRGRKISEAEHKEATEKMAERRRAIKAGEKTDAMDEDEEEDDDENDEYEWEVFPTADDLAICIAEDLWPNAIKYFMAAQEIEDLSDLDFEDDDEDEEMEGTEDAAPSKKRKV